MLTRQLARAVAGRDGSLATKTEWSGTRSRAVLARLKLTGATATSTAQKIGAGHASVKHAGEFASGADLKAIAESTILNGTHKDLARGRSAYYDSGTNTVVLHDPSSGDLGTVFKPRDGQAYFAGLA